MPPLTPEDVACLLALRAGRPLCGADLGSPAAGPLALDRRELRRLAASPLCRRLGGRPGEVVAAAAEVHADLVSLLEHPWLHPSS
mmetsp:Transcript_76503/g.227973  ORF Transcript_76503/g.227973 Transcript_76503/m.227973 type:complete len:85 (-) Transcript_76503:79-333(-)